MGVLDWVIAGGGFTALAALITAVAKAVRSDRKSVVPRDAQPASGARSASRGELEALERRLVAAEARIERCAGCDARLDRVEDEQGRLKDRLHEVEMNAVERQTEVRERLGHVLGALDSMGTPSGGSPSRRGGR